MAKIKRRMIALWALTIMIILWGCAKGTSPVFRGVPRDFAGKTGEWSLVFASEERILLKNTEDLAILQRSGEIWGLTGTVELEPLHYFEKGEVSTQLSFSADGRYALAANRDSREEAIPWPILLVDLDKNHAKAVGETKSGDEAAAFSPDGRWCAVVQERDVVLVECGTGEMKTRDISWFSGAPEKVWAGNQGEVLLQNGAMTAKLTEKGREILEDTTVVHFDGDHLWTLEAGELKLAGADGASWWVPAGYGLIQLEGERAVFRKENDLWLFDFGQRRAQSFHLPGGRTPVLGMELMLSPAGDQALLLDEEGNMLLDREGKEAARLEGSALQKEWIWQEKTLVHVLTQDYAHFIVSQYTPDQGFRTLYHGGEKAK
ncbi:TolB-like translocation protein [Gehongia tenuis]|uniref:Uncharacterized protein n=1 Tax=Gehongia tenuis TaxID=2763655 RepID=A0A926D6K4_9FIRM|nr:hypothetical protein [Gehongia tenuis]MBC8532333.1 hypothetical protein [Gehongia tenuis]